jgi:hypothetical protein
MPHLTLDEKAIDVKIPISNSYNYKNKSKSTAKMDDPQHEAQESKLSKLSNLNINLLTFDIIFTALALTFVFCDALSKFASSILREPGYIREENGLIGFINAAWPFVAARAVGVFMDLGFWLGDEIVIEKILKDGESGEGEESGEKVEIPDAKRLLERKIRLDAIGRVLAYGVFVMVFWGKALV